MDRPTVICHMLMALDGKINGTFFSAPETMPALSKYSDVRKFYDCPAKCGKTNAQIILRWHIQSGNVVLPGSKNPDQIRDNFNIFDFVLSDEDMAQIAKVNKNKRYYMATPKMIATYANMELRPDL